VWIIPARVGESDPVKGLVFNPGSGQLHGTWWNDKALFREVVMLFLCCFNGSVARKLYGKGQGWSFRRIVRMDKR
jgi:hypothetical protein